MVNNCYVFHKKLDKWGVGPATDDKAVYDIWEIRGYHGQVLATTFSEEHASVIAGAVNAEPLYNGDRAEFDR